MQIHLLGNRVGVEKFKKQSNKSDGFLVMVETEEYLGVVKYVGNGPGQAQSIKVGDKVYFGSKFQPVRMGGSEICVMEEDNVLAKVTDDNV